jgi:pimeloyl-ACP methyl ester carboxylesterase
VGLIVLGEAIGMPRLAVNGAELNYEEHGGGAETIVFAHGLLWSGRMFDPQVAVLKERYRCITFDFRGQGQSEVTRSGYDMESLTKDAAALIEALGAAPCHFVGLSMGGFIGMRLAMQRPELLRSLILIESTADGEPQENVLPYKLMAWIARWLSVRLVAGRVMAIMFGEKFLNDPARAAQREQYARDFVDNSPVGTYRATLGVVHRRPIIDEIHKVRLPTLVVAGEQDRATVPAKSQRIHERIAGSKLVIIPGAGHSSSVEEPAAVTSAIRDFLGTTSR